MTRLSFAQDLETAAARIGELDRAELAVMLRRAAIRLRNIEDALASEGETAAFDLPGDVEVKVDDSVTEALRVAAAEMDKSPEGALAEIVKDWLIGHGYLPRQIEEDDETDGMA